MIFLGCDGGSTKTEWLLADDSARILAHRVFDGCNLAYLGKEVFARRMREDCSTLLADGNVTAADVTGAMFGMTAYGEAPGNEDVFAEVIGSILPECSHIMIENDSVAGWSGSLGGRPGVNIVSGTGSIAYGRDPARNSCRVCGYSLIFSDEGSCSWIGRQVIAEFIKQADGRHPRTMLYELFRKELKLTKDLYLCDYLNADVLADSSLLARFQLIALRAAEAGDASMQALYRRAAAELTEMAVAVREQLEFSAEPVRASYSGGLFRAGEIILNPFRAAMEAAGFILTSPLYAPVVGAVALAAENDLSLAEIEPILAAAAKSRPVS